jgi:hypothetical protein
MKSFKEYMTGSYPPKVFTVHLDSDYQNIGDDIKRLERDEIRALSEILKEATDYINNHPELLI